MKTGKVIGIFITQKKGDPILSLDQVHVLPGLGIEGDRYFDYRHNPEIDSKAGREITLIEMEAIESMRDDEGINISPEQTRRNILTRGISLNELVDHDFLVGDVQLHGVRLCEPCQYLADRTDQRVLQSMVHRGGLRADVVSAGIIRINDLITYSD
jgi:MOSC domain-containing protein YiiM